MQNIEQIYETVDQLETAAKCDLGTTFLRKMPNWTKFMILELENNWVNSWMRVKNISLNLFHKIFYLVKTFE
jgi:hypothetical protein